MSNLAIAVLTVSDTRTEENDTSGDLLCQRARDDAHHVVDRAIVIDDIYQIRARVSTWIATKEVDVVISTGGTGFSGRDTTPEAVAPLFDTTIEGFGELFRQISFEEIGSSTVQSRALGGIANNTLIFALPGSTGACQTGWDKLLHDQLNSSFRPCNFA